MKNALVFSAWAIIFIGLMKRKDAILLGRYWTGLRYAIRIEPLGHRDHVHVYLKIGPKA
jgi:hypothetical protein